MVSKRWSQKLYLSQPFIIAKNPMEDFDNEPKINYHWRFEFFFFRKTEREKLSGDIFAELIEWELSTFARQLRNYRHCLHMKSVCIFVDGETTPIAFTLMYMRVRWIHDGHYDQSVVLLSYLIRVSLLLARWEFTLFHPTGEKTTKDPNREVQNYLPS